jgi:hypothetical protein
MEEKAVLSALLRQFNLTARAVDIPLLAEVVLRPKNGLQLTLFKR